MTPPEGSRPQRRDEGGLHRALAEITIGTARKIRARDAREAQVAIEEMDLQYQLPVTGTADTGAAFATIDLDFDADFFYAPGQRDSELTRPHMTFGAEADSAVMLTATVTEWKIDDDNGAITGCVLAVGTMAGESTDFTGLVHVNFQGWGAVREPDSDLG